MNSFQSGIGGAVPALSPIVVHGGENWKRSDQQRPKHQTGKRAAGKQRDGAQPETAHRDEGRQNQAKRAKHWRAKGAASVLVFALLPKPMGTKTKAEHFAASSLLGDICVPDQSARTPWHVILQRRGSKRSGMIACWSDKAACFNDPDGKIL